MAKFQVSGFEPYIIFAERDAEGKAVTRGMIPNVATQCLDDENNDDILDIVYLHSIVPTGGMLSRNIPITINVASDHQSSSSTLLYVKLKITYGGKDKVVSWSLSKSSAVNNEIKIQMPFSYILDFIYDNYVPGSKDLSYYLSLSVTTEPNIESYCVTISYSAYSKRMESLTAFTAKVLDVIGLPPINGNIEYLSIDSSNFGYDMPFHLEIEPLEVDVSKRPFLNTVHVPYYRSTHVNGINIVRTCSDKQLAVIRDFFKIAVSVNNTRKPKHSAVRVIDFDAINIGSGEAYTVFNRTELAIIDSASALTGNIDIYAKNDNIYTSQHDFSDYSFSLVFKLNDGEEKVWFNILDPDTGELGDTMMISFDNLLHDLEPVMSIQDRSVHFSPHANIDQPDINDPATFKTYNHKHKRLTDGVALIDSDLRLLKGTSEYGVFVSSKIMGKNTVRTDNLSNVLTDHLDSCGSYKRFFNYLGGIPENYTDELPHPYFRNRPFLLEVGSPFGCKVGPTGDYEYTAFQTITFFHPNPNLDEGNEATHMLMTEFDRTVCEFAHSGKVCSPWRHKMTVSVVCDVPHKLYQGTFHPDSNKFFSCDFSKPEIVFRLIN